MDFGKANFVFSRTLKKQLQIFKSERQVGFVLKFHKRNLKKLHVRHAKN